MAYNLSSRLFSPWLKYRTNDNLLLGVGYTYSFLTLNLALKMPFINGDDDVYGKSNYLDLNVHTIFRSYIIDFYLQWNKGYFVSNPGKVGSGLGFRGNAYPLRGDLRTHVMGVSIQHLFNSSRYSYKAAFLQNEFQKRSAGSPLVGLEAYYMQGIVGFRDGGWEYSSFRVPGRSALQPGGRGQCGGERGLCLYLCLEGKTLPFPVHAVWNIGRV
jgi:hypothetical protein